MAGLDAIIAGFTERGDALRDRVSQLRLPTPPASFGSTIGR